MADEEGFRRVDAARLEAMVTELYVRAGVPTANAARLANALVDADLRGVHSHGCRYVSGYLKGIRQGGLNGNPQLKTIRDHGATVLLDADGGIGHVVGYRAMGLAVERAKQHGIATVLLRNNGHVGALAYFTQIAADSGCIGYASTSGGIVMIPPGGAEKITGLNPLSWAVPTSRPWSLNLDMATSVVAGSKLLMAHERGQKIPLGWALDPDGNPTTEPMLGMQGGLLPVGGPKGYGLSVIIDVMGGVLSGGRFGKGLGSRGSTLFTQAIDIEHFTPLDEFRERTEQLIAQIKTSKLAPGSEGIFFPGELEYNRKAERLVHGIPLDDHTRAELKREAEEAGVAYEVELA